MKKILIKVLYKIIEIIERFQYRNETWDENNIDLKIQSSYDIAIDVLTDTGYKKTLQIHRTQPYVIWELTTNTGLKLKCADNHIIYGLNGECFVKDLQIGDLILTREGFAQVSSLLQTTNRVCMYDLSIEGPNYRYWTNDILSHNTICTSIYILWYILFNNNKNVMIVANKKETVEEIVNKVKDIYKNLPFFLKAGIINYRNDGISLETESRIKTQGRSKELAIGFTIDILYMDEFAHIEKNIQGPYYENAIPTISSMLDSKIIITSTPHGRDLFFELVTDAELPPDHPDQNGYSCLRIYWWQVAGRDDIWIEPIEDRFKERGIDIEEFKQYLLDLNFNLIREDHYNKKNKSQLRYRVKHSDYNFEDLSRVNELKWRDEPITNWANITSWKNNAIKEFGGGQKGIEKFGQQYDLIFDLGSKMLFNGETMNFIISHKKPFIYEEIPRLTQVLSFEYKELKWIEDCDLFELDKIKSYHLIISLDFSNGLGKDYSVCNIFRLLPMEMDEIIKNKSSHTIYDFFRLHQVGLYRNHNIDLQGFADICYELFFNLCDPEKIKVVIEANTFGGEFLSKMQLTHGGNNDFASHIFARYKHSYNSPFLKPGVLLNGVNKNLYIKEFHKMLEKMRIRIYEELSIKEIGSFTKKETRAGNESYKSETGNDDIIMSTVNLCTIFDTIDWKNMVENYINTVMEKDPRREVIENKVKASDFNSVVDYSVVSKNKGKSFLDRKNKDKDLYEKKYK